MTRHPITRHLLQMAQAATREQAQQHARDMLADGASPALVADALTEWDALNARQVQTVHSDPMPTPPKCGCQHSHWRHDEWGCRARRCACREYDGSHVAAAMARHPAGKGRTA